jgi:NADH-quinone oxidoreductase subunit A
MVNAWIPILLFFLVAVAFGIVTLLFARLIAPQRYAKVKLEPYECGIEPATDARDRYSVKYFLVAMLFLIFDVETIFLYPWAVIVDELAWFGFIEMVVFLFILVVGYFYAWREGALDWAS